jgi:hypothetical protein
MAEKPRVLVPEYLQPGDRFRYRVRDDVEVVVLVIRSRESWTDRFGREMWRYWCMREDTRAQGWMTFGPDAFAVPAAN